MQKLPVPAAHDPSGQLVAAAYHEAGHAIVADGVGYTVTLVSVDGEGFGNTGFRAPSTDYSRGSMAGRWRLLMVSLAGSLAEAIYLDRPDIGSLDEMVDSIESDLLLRPQDEREWHGEAGNVAQLVEHLDPAERQAELAEARDDALVLLRERWDDVEGLAEELLEHGEVDYAQPPVA